MARALGKVTGVIALLWSAAALFVLCVGGFRLEWSGFQISASERWFCPHLLGQFLVFAAIATILAPTRPWWRSLSFYLPVLSLRIIRRGIKLNRSNILATLVLVLLVLQLGARVQRNTLIGQAERLEASGDFLGAAAIYENAHLGYDPLRWELLLARGNCLYRAGEFEACVEALDDIVRSGQHPTKLAYRALWKSLLELERYSEAREIIQAAMGQRPSMGRECTELLALVYRRETRTHAKPVSVRFHYWAEAEEDGPLFLAGNWSPHLGRRDELTGYEPLAMSRELDGSWTTSASLVHTGDLPFSAFVQDVPGRFEGTALAHAVFSLENGKSTAEVHLLPLGPRSHMQSETELLKRPADGRRRVLALWPDGLSWMLLNTYIRRGWMPNARRLTESGTRFRMRSTEPPYTSTAYQQMVNLDAGVRASSSTSFLSTLAIQLKGIPFLDSLFPDSVATASNVPGNIFNVLGSNGVRAVNLVFNDRYLFAGNDLMDNSGHTVKAKEQFEGRFDVHRSLDNATTNEILRHCLEVDPEEEAERWGRLRDASALAMGLRNSEEKLQAGLDVWRDLDPDFLLLRLPAVDILSHYYVGGLWEDPLPSLLAETYRHVDRVLGILWKQLDADDTIILVSDHGILATANHHWSCVLIGAGPGLEEGGLYPSTIPIGHFPCFILGRFGLEDGSDRLTDEERDLFFRDAPRPK